MISTSSINRRRPRTVSDYISPVPTDIPNLIMWQRADKGVYTDLGVTPAQSGQAVKQWNDLSGNGNHLIGNVGSGATILNNGINGQTVLSFSASSAYAPANTSIWPVSPGRTQVFVWRSTSTSPGCLSSGLNSASATHAWYIQSGQEVIYPTNTGSSQIGFLTQGGSIVANTNYSSYERFVGTVNSSTVYRNGVVVGANLCSTPIPNAVTSDLAMQIGCYKTGSTLFNGYIAEHMLFNRPLSGPELRQINRYIYNRYGISPPLPKPLLVFAGNSLTYGTNSSSGIGTCTGTCYPGVTLATLAGYGNYNAVNCGVGSQTTTMTLAYADSEITPLYQDGASTKSICLYWEITNGLTAVASGTAGQTQIISDVTNYCLARRARGFKVIVFTCLPRGSTSQFETDRQAVNSYIRSNWASFADGLADVGTDATIGVAGAQNNATYYSGDLTHLTDAGYAIVANTYAVPAILALG